MIEHVLKCDEEMGVVIFFIGRAVEGGEWMRPPTVSAVWGV